MKIMNWTSKDRITDLWHQSPEELKEMLALWPRAYHGPHRMKPTACCGAGEVGEIHSHEGTAIGVVYCFKCGAVTGEY